MGDAALLNGLEGNSLQSLIALAQPGGLDISGLIVGSVFGLIGFLAFLNGKKHGAWGRMVIGITLMAYSYFIPSLLWTCLIGTALTALLYFWRG